MTQSAYSDQRAAYTSQFAQSTPLAMGFNNNDATMNVIRQDIHQASASHEAAMNAVRQELRQSNDAVRALATSVTGLTSLVQRQTVAMSRMQSRLDQLSFSVLTLANAKKKQPQPEMEQERGRVFRDNQPRRIEDELEDDDWRSTVALAIQALDHRTRGLKLSSPNKIQPRSDLESVAEPEENEVFEQLGELDRMSKVVSQLMSRMDQ
ncbi:hypothetical protein J8273_7902 [Carpediemonas membranifera]|uniref:Uncharacterized protein n=1 Tax=Carpediemonas membranifera TaxID=201153 RepID=A0A8J6DZL1_9EUKA|nr:hypothetical protein J8273_7902 [Carpediemonas membranifera]|eukprot:KAG9390551.1 hypothetical protein J8273_7902 [Carpediemonas membranifera]